MDLRVFNHDKGLLSKTKNTCVSTVASREALVYDFIPCMGCGVFGAGVKTFWSKYPCN